ncbi:MAG: sulfite exporter TauE/SafE family protein, partial [Caldimicrobium sp.]
MRKGVVLFWLLLILLILFKTQLFAGEVPKELVEGGSTLPWWVWPLLLFIVTFILGIIAVLGGVGGGVLFVPIVGGFFPFNLDFVRGAGLLVALSGALAAGPGLLKRGLADLRLAIPLALIASSSAIIGAMIGLSLP